MYATDIRFKDPKLMTVAERLLYDISYSVIFNLRFEDIVGIGVCLFVDSLHLSIILKFHQVIGLASRTNCLPFGTTKPKGS